MDGEQVIEDVLALIEARALAHEAQAVEVKDKADKEVSDPHLPDYVDPCAIRGNAGARAYELRVLAAECRAVSAMIADWRSGDHE